jgi:protein O-GlcNAc transferase
MTILQALQIALQHHQAGRLSNAEALYRQILAVQPNHADALHFLGVIAHQVGRHDVAMELIRQSIVLNPRNSAAHSNLGEACRAADQQDEAIAAYRRALELEPDYPEAHNNLGNALRDQGRIDDAITAWRSALKVKPDYLEAHTNLGNALREQGRLDDAIAAYGHALEHRPDYAEGHTNLGNALWERGRLDEAIVAHRRALQLQPDLPEAHNNLGNALRDQGRIEEAITAWRHALRLKPDYPEVRNNLGNALLDQGQIDEAIAAYRHALEVKPDYPDAHYNLGAALREQGQLDEAIASYRHALRLKPDYPDALNRLGNALAQRGEFSEAIGAWRRALELKPDLPHTPDHLGVALRDQGELDEAIAVFRRALQFQPESSSTHSNLIFALHLHPGHDSKASAEEHQRWNRQFSDPLRQFVLPHLNERNAERRLRVGYVSPDFRDHPVGRFALPLIERLDRERFEVLCYSGLEKADWVTERFRAMADQWRETAGVPDAELAEMIREDKVDILVDLAMHTEGNRLRVFARQPAPVQVAWLGYPGSTGLTSIGYRLTDAYMDPPGEDSAWSTEKAVRLPDCWCCYDPAGDSPDVNALPALTAEGVTFGSLNSFCKLNEQVLNLWARVLKEVKRSRLVMLCPEGPARERVRAFFGTRGITADRVELTAFVPRREYLTHYHRIDLALDPFPYNGMTTTCDALWMGVPVLTLPGKMPVSRAGLSVLSNVGLAELAASSEEDYLRLAADLAGNLPRLADLRASLRARMQASPLMDAPRFARNVEAAYRKMWEAWRSGTTSIG